jgi:vitamin B12 transporter
MKYIYISLLALLIIDASAQQNISGTVTDQKGNPIMYANIYFEGSYDGTTTDSMGHFTLNTDLIGEQLFVASFIGYEKYSRELELGSVDTSIAIIMEEQISEINEVAITAGVFSASDKKKSATLTSFDIATTSSAMGDIYGAYATMPGSQKVGEEGMLFVRGGESYETKTYMDGMLVQTPYFTSMPDIPTRGRFSPLLFSETIFSTGGYSAEYGNALSSIVDLTTNGLETENKTSVSIMTVGANASVSRRWKNTSLAVTGLYADNTLHHKLFKQTVDWIEDPVIIDGMMMFRQRIGETGLLKSFCSFNSNSLEMNYDNFESGTMDEIQMNNHNLYANTTYSDQLNDKWMINTGVAYSQDIEDMKYDGFPIQTNNSAVILKLVFTHLTSEKMKIRFGGDLIQEWYQQSVTMDSTINLKLEDLQPSLFVESELKISKKAALRIGVRSEYSSLLEEVVLAPRVSAAYKTGKFSQVSLAWGKYRQKPENDYLMFAPWLSSERSDHYILNFQYRKDSRIFRIESYIKQYNDLVKYNDLYSSDVSNYNNDGDGHAHGLDLFWRDSKTIKGGDYWVSYSYLKTTRDYKDYSERTMPDFASAHNLSLVYKQFITPLSTFAGITYSFASARPYDDKNSSEFMSGRTKPYNDISLNITYITQLFKHDCIIHMNITNLFGFDNVFGYRYTGVPGEDGHYASQAVVPTVGRQAVLLFMLSL